MQRSGHYSDPRAVTPQSPELPRTVWAGLSNMVAGPPSTRKSLGSTSLWSLAYQRLRGPPQAGICYPSVSKPLKVILDIYYRCGIMGWLSRHIPSACPTYRGACRSRSCRDHRFQPCRKGGCLANRAQLPRAPSYCHRLFAFLAFTFSPAPRSPNLFRCNTYGSPRKLLQTQDLRNSQIL